MTRWHIMLTIHIALATAVLCWALWGAYTFWAATFGSPWAALGVIVLIEAGALAGYALHILGSSSPVALARHALPIVSVAPAAKSLHDLAARQVGDGWAWAVAIVLALVLAVAAWAVWAGLERLLIDRDARQREQRIATIARIQSETAHALALIALMREALAQVETPLLPAAREMPMPAPQAIITCARCGAEVPVPTGKHPAAVRAATGRYGCAQCREGSHAT